MGALLLVIVLMFGHPGAHPPWGDAVREAIHVQAVTKAGFSVGTSPVVISDGAHAKEFRLFVESFLQYVFAGFHRHAHLDSWPYILRSPHRPPLNIDKQILP